jgi:hypothetical protein
MGRGKRYMKTLILLLSSLIPHPSSTRTSIVQYHLITQQLYLIQYPSDRRVTQSWAQKNSLRITCSAT